MLAASRSRLVSASLCLKRTSATPSSSARRRAEELGIRNARFTQIDAETSIDLEAGSVDGALCRWGYMLMADPGSALRETRRVLRPGARVAMAAWTGRDDNPWSVLPSRELIERGIAEPPDPNLPGQFAWGREGLIGEQLDAAGFGEHHVETLDFTFDYASAEDWWASQSEYSSWFAKTIAGASDEDVAAVRAAVDRHAEGFTDAAGTVKLPARTWVAWAAA